MCTNIGTKTKDEDEDEDERRKRQLRRRRRTNKKKTKMNITKYSDKVQQQITAARQQYKQANLPFSVSSKEAFRQRSRCGLANTFTS